MVSKRAAEPSLRYRADMERSKYQARCRAFPSSTCTLPRVNMYMGVLAFLVYCGPRETWTRQ